MTRVRDIQNRKLLACNGFPTTHWSLLEEAKQGWNEDQVSMIGEFLQRYRSALLAHLVYQRKVPLNAAEDVLHDFFRKKIIEKNLLASADQEKGRFRNLILTALDRFWISEVRKLQAQKNAPNQALHLEDLPPFDPVSPNPTPSEAFDVAWAREILHQTMERMQAHCHATGREALWGIFEHRILRPILERANPEPYAQLIKKFPFSSPIQASNALLTAKRMFIRTVHEVIKEYAGDKEEVEREIVQLRIALSSAGPLPGTPSTSH